AGAVGSAYERTRASRDAWVAGVKAVNTSGLKVSSQARDEMTRTSKYAVKSEDEIREAVKGAFLYDPRVSMFRPEVIVQRDVVTLRGVVDNLKAKKAAEEDARNTIGVARVKNHIKVRPATPADDLDIADRVRKSLQRTPDIDHFQVRVSVIDGRVYLAGNVDSFFEKKSAEDAAARVNGVTRVVNRLQVNAVWMWKHDWEIKEDIESELWWSPFVDSDTIRVSVRDGTATLTGTVNSWQERTWAAENAYEGGAKSIRNYLRLRQNGDLE
ncbi:MAG: BON domain-containing protein, partial [Nitrospiraceae bacterium]